MALNLRNRETNRLARALAQLTGESIGDAVRVALAERLEREQIRRAQRTSVTARLAEIAAACAALPDLDMRRIDDIAGYDTQGSW